MLGSEGTDISDVFIAWGPVLAPLFATVAAIVSAMYAKGARTLAKHTDREVNNKEPGEPTLRQMVIDLGESQKQLCGIAKKHEEMLHAIQHSTSQNNARIQHILSSFATFEADAEGSYIWVSRKWAELTGISLGDATGREWEDAIYELDKQRVTDDWFRATSQHESFGPIMYRITHERTGEVKWVNAEASPVRNSDGSLIGYVGSLDVMDIEGWENPPPFF
jgi:PAS domain S-box-containing protein